jgi:transposase
VFLGVDAHKLFHVAALVDEHGAELGALSFPNSAAGVRLLRDRRCERGGEQALVGVEGAGHYGRVLCLGLVAAGHEVLDVPPWRTRRDRRMQGLGKTDVADAVAIAHVVRLKCKELAPALSPELVRALALLELLRRQAVKDAPRRSSGCARCGFRWTLRPRARSGTAIARRWCTGFAGSASGRGLPPRLPRAAYASLPGTSSA